MEDKVLSEMPKILKIFNSITFLPTMVYRDNYEYFSSYGCSKDDIDKFKITLLSDSTPLIKKEGITFIKNVEECYAVKMVKLNVLKDYLFVIGPYKSCSGKLSFIDDCPKDNECIGYAFSTLEFILKDKFSYIFKTNNSIGLHISKAISIIHNSYSEDINVCNISKTLGINKCYFCSLFKKETGMTFSKFLNQFRINKSKILLKDMNHSILDIAIEVGFNNQNYYTIAFKQFEGITPKEYRRCLT